MTCRRRAAAAAFVVITAAVLLSFTPNEQTPQWSAQVGSEEPGTEPEANVTSPMITPDDDAAAATAFNDSDHTFPFPLAATVAELKLSWNYNSRSSSSAIMERASYFSTQSARDAVDHTTRNVTTFQRRSACTREPLKFPPGSTVPRNVRVSGPCFANDDSLSGRKAAEQLRRCSCDSVVTYERNVMWTTEATNRHTAHSIAVGRYDTRGDGALEWCAIDRSNIYLGLFRCAGYYAKTVRLAHLMEKIIAALPHNVSIKDMERYRISLEEEGEVRGKDQSKSRDVYFAVGTTIGAPGHRLENLITAAAQYFAAGLHLRRIAWVVPSFTSIGGNVRSSADVAQWRDVTQAYRELAQLLNITVLEYQHNTLQFADGVYFPEQEQGESSMCYKPFIERTLWPLVRAEAARRKLKPIPHVAFLKTIGSHEFSKGRSFEFTNKFRKFAKRINLRVFNVLPLYKKMFYINTASVIVTNWGASASFVFLLMVPREVHVLVVVHSGYKHETGHIGIQWGRVKEKRSTKVLMTGEISRVDFGGWDMQHQGLFVRFIHVRELHHIHYGDLRFP